MNNPTRPLTTRPGAHSANNARQAAAHSAHPIGENLMVGTTRTVEEIVTEIQDRLYRHADRFIQADYATGTVKVFYWTLATVVHEIVTEHTTALRAERDEVARELELSEESVAELNYQLDHPDTRGADEGPVS